MKYEIPWMNWVVWGIIPPFLALLLITNTNALLDKLEGVSCLMKSATNCGQTQVLTSAEVNPPLHLPSRGFWVNCFQEAECQE